MQVTIEIPDQFLDSLIPAGADPARTLFEQSVAAAYRDRRIGPEEVRVLLSLPTSVHVLEFLQKYDVWGYTIEDLDSDLAALESLRARSEAGKAA